MTKPYFWLRTAAVLQLLTASIHSLSFFNDPVPQNESERTLIDLMRNYEQNLAGMMVTMEDMMTSLSACFTLICAFGGWLNLYLSRNSPEPALLKGILGIQVVIFGILFAVMALLTFPPPIICTGLIFMALALAYWKK